MEAQQNDDGGSSGGKGSTGGFLCRQSSTRWTPTTDQIRILKELYYNNGVRSPTAEQIQRISARLRQYGKIEGKNVFYWFQNHKARERQKKRFTTTTTTASTTNDHNNQTPMQRGIMLPTAWKPDHHQSFNHNIKYSPVVSSTALNSSATSMLGGVGQMGHFGYGGVNFRESCGSSGVNGGSISHNFGWVGVADPYSSTYNALFEKRSSTIPFEEALEEEEEEEEEEEGNEAEYEEIHAPEIETLPLFPMHAEDINGFANNFKPNYSGGGGAGYYSGWCSPDGGGHGGSRASLELRLNSYSRSSPDSF